MKKYRRLVLGGTFDHLHLGHQKFLDKAFSLAEKVNIGLMDNPEWLISKKFSLGIESFKKRKSILIKYLKSKQYLERSTIIPLNDIYGNTIIEKNLDAILVTRQTLKNALLINNLRQKKGINKLDIIEIEIQNDKKEQIISSERIRKGEINRYGFNYFDIFNKRDLILPQTKRFSLRKPLGKIYPKLPVIKKNKVLIVSVGDIVSQSFVDKGIIPDVRIIDHKSRRKPLVLNELASTRIINKPGTINKQAVRFIQDKIQKVIKDHKRRLIEINGEEDLLVLPAILLLPLGSLVYYGQFDVGVVEVRITEQIKEKVRKILKLFI